MSLSLKLLGEFSVRDEAGEPLALPTRKTRALLAYLAANADKPQRRDRLMALLWSDRGEQQARHSLNQALMSIRRLGNAAGTTMLDSDGERVKLLADMLAIDLADFRDLLAKDSERAASLYEGPFLDGLTIPDPAFEEWLTVIRSELHNSACDALSRAADQAAKDGDTAKGIGFLRRLVAFDPLREDAHRRLMKALYDVGDRAGALRQYQACLDILGKELQVEPGAATKALFENVRSEALASPTTEPAAPTTESELSKPVLLLPDKPSIAVLPFDNLGGDPVQDFVGDGIAEDIITALSRFHSLFVIARGSSFSFRGQSLDTREIAKRLGVRYVLEGSVRSHGSRIRINAQLIDAENAHHVWSERYDRETKDIFALQDEITERIASIIEPEIVRAEQTKTEREAPDRLQTWSLYQQGVSLYYNKMTPENRTAAIAKLRQAISKDPTFAPAHAYLALCIQNGIAFGFYNDPQPALADGLKAANKAIQLDPMDALSPYALGRVHTAFGRVYGRRQDFRTAIGHLRTAIELNSNFAVAYYGLAHALYFAERPEESIENAQKALRLSPNAPNLYAFCIVQALAYFSMDKGESALEWIYKTTQQPNAPSRFYAPYAVIAAYYGASDHVSAAISELRKRLGEAEICRVISDFMSLYPQREKWEQGFRMAGLLK